MPGILDAARGGARTYMGNSTAVDCEYQTAIERGMEIRELSEANQKVAQRDLLPELEQINAALLNDSKNHLAALRKFNEKAGKWIDEKLGLSTP